MADQARAAMTHTAVVHTLPAKPRRWYTPWRRPGPDIDLSHHLVVDENGYSLPFGALMQAGTLKPNTRYHMSIRVERGIDDLRLDSDVSMAPSVSPDASVWIRRRGSY